MPFRNRVVDWLQRIRSDFDTTPDRRLTFDEAETLWDVEPDLLRVMLDALVDVGFLRRSPDGTYRRR